MESELTPPLSFYRRSRSLSFHSKLNGVIHDTNNKKSKNKNQTVGNTRPYDTCLMFPLEPTGSTGVEIHISEVTVVNKAESISGSE